MPRFRQRNLITWDVGGKTEIPTVREIISISRFFKDESSITLNKGSYINYVYSWGREEVSHMAIL